MTEYKLPIMGARFRKPAVVLLNNLPTGTEFELRPEPTNQFDSFAVAIWLKSKNILEEHLARMSDDLSQMGFEVADIRETGEFHLGYIPKEIASWMQGKIQGQLGGTCFAKLSFLADGKPAVEFALADRPSDSHGDLSA